MLYHGGSKNSIPTLTILTRQHDAHSAYLLHSHYAIHKQAEFAYYITMSSHE